MRSIFIVGKHIFTDGMGFYYFSFRNDSLIDSTRDYCVIVDFSEVFLV